MTWEIKAFWLVAWDIVLGQQTNAAAGGTNAPAAGGTNYIADLFWVDQK